jgi:hypothetical protein
MKDRSYWTRPIILTLWTEIIFRRVGILRKETIKLRYICPSICNNSAPTGKIFMTIGI